jgi:zinc protease
LPPVIERLPMKLFSLFCGLYLCLAGQVAEAGPKIEHWVADSGARVFFVENHALPILDVQVDFAAGSAYDTPKKSGLASLTHSLLDMGVQGMDETQIASRLADLGAKLSGATEMDRASLALRTLSAADKRTPALDILRAVLVSPQFPTAVFEREKARSLAALKESLTRPETIASRAFWSALYPEHPYGLKSTPESIAALTRDELASFYKTHYTAQRASVAIVGDLSRSDAEALAQHLTANLPHGAELSAPSEPKLPHAAEQRIAHPAAQAHILLGLPAIKRGDPDFFPLLVGNYSLGGGGFVSRLMKEVRDQRGLAYSVHSYFQPMAQLGPFQMSLQTKKTQANEALKVAREVLEGFLAEGPSASELNAAKQNLMGSFPLRLDSNKKILDNLSVIGFYGLSLNYLEHYAENIETVTQADIKAAFSRHVKPEHLITVVVAGE